MTDRLSPGHLRLAGSRLTMHAVVAATYAFLLLAPLVVIYYSFSPGVVLEGPAEGMTLRWYRNFAQQPRLVSGFGYSLLIAVFSSLAATAIGVPAALGLTRSQLPGRRLLLAVLLSPLTLPGIVLAIGILMVIVAIVQPLTHVRLVGGVLPLLAAHLIVTIPWVIRTVVASLETMDITIEEAARGLGATAVDTFRLVTLPAIAPGVVAGAIFAFIVSFGNFALSLFFTSGTVTTLPVAVFQYIDQFQDPTVAAASSVVIAITTIVVLVADRVAHFTRRPGAVGQEHRS